MTLIEVLVAGVLVAGVVSTLGLWSFKAPWNQKAHRRQVATSLLREGFDRNLRILPESPRSWIEPASQGWSVRWRWSSLGEGGWLLEGDALDPAGRSVERLLAARWAP
jgi:Tfp pilus assembly protein PilV